jgi:hypothetical protein
MTSTTRHFFGRLYPELNDVWSNQLCSFLSSSVIQTRKWFAVVRYEFIHRMVYMMNQCDVSKVRAFLLNPNARYRSSQLTPNHFLLVWRFAQDEYLPTMSGTTILLHISDRGVVHCMTDKGGIKSEFQQEDCKLWYIDEYRNMTIHLKRTRREWPEVWQMKGWNLDVDKKDVSPCLCRHIAHLSIVHK